MADHKTSRLGDIGVAVATADLLRKGYDVLAPVNATAPYDLVISKAGKYQRVQVKYRNLVNGCLQVELRRSVISNAKHAHAPNREVDVVCVVNGTQCYYSLPKPTISIRVEAAKKAQKKRMNFAAAHREVPDAG